MRRFSIDPALIHDGHVLLSKKESHHALSVLRLKTGDEVEVFDGSGIQRRAVASRVLDGRLLLNLYAPASKTDPLDAEITLAVAVIKPERMVLLIQKSCELGASRIVPLITERCVIKLSKERWDAKTLRWKKIIVEACKQCGQNVFPVMAGPQKFDSFLKQTTADERLLIPTLAVPGKHLSEVLERPVLGKTTVLIGPEGDFTRNEAEMAIAHGATALRLGSLVMRTETAAIYTLSILSFCSINRLTSTTTDGILP